MDKSMITRVNGNLTMYENLIPNMKSSLQPMIDAAEITCKNGEKADGIEDEALYQKIASQGHEIAEYRCRYEFLQEDLN